MVKKRIKCHYGTINMGKKNYLIGAHIIKHLFLMTLQRNGQRYQLNRTADRQNHHVYYQIWWNFSIKAISQASLDPALQVGNLFKSQIKMAALCGW